MSNHRLTKLQSGITLLICNANLICKEIDSIMPTRVVKITSKGQATIPKEISKGKIAGHVSLYFRRSPYEPLKAHVFVRYD